MVNTSVMSYIVPACYGAGVGALVSLVVNSVMMELFLNNFVAIIFGLVFLLVAGLMFQRSVSMWRAKSCSLMEGSLLVIVSLTVFISGISCFFLQYPGFVGLSPAAKSPVVVLLGLSSCLTFLFALIDVIQSSCKSNAQKDQDNKPVYTPHQFWLFLAFSLVIGSLFGIIFAAMDLEDQFNARVLRARLLQEHLICYPIGAVLGALAAVIDRKLSVKVGAAQYAELEVVDPSDGDLNKNES